MMSIEELKEQIKKQPTCDDLVSAVIFKAKEDRIPKSQAFLQQAFYHIKNEFPDDFSDFIFDESGLTPFSDKLDSILFRLEASAILSTLNPTYENYTITNSPDQLELSYKKFKSPFTEKIDQMAIFFSKMVKEQITPKCIGV